MLHKRIFCRLSFSPIKFVWFFNLEVVNIPGNYLPKMWTSSFRTVWVGLFRTGMERDVVLQ